MTRSKQPVRLLALAALLGGCTAPDVPVQVLDVTDLSAEPGAWSLHGDAYRTADGLIEVYFTNPGVLPGDEEDPLLDDAVIAMIDGADTIEASWFEFGRQPIVDAMSAAADRGATIRFAGDGDEEHDAGYEALAQRGVPLALRAPRDRIMHNKFAVFDAKWVWTGSTNMSENGVLFNNNGSLAIDDPTLAAYYRAELAQMVDDGLFGRKKTNLDPGTTLNIGTHEVEVHFSPGDPEQALLDVLDTADSTVLFMVFSFTRADIADKLIALHESGVQVVGIFDESQGNGRYSADEKLAAAGVPVFIDGNDNAYGFSGGKLHHKSLLVDPLNATSEPTVIVGSYNWSNSATDYNDENLLVIRGTPGGNEIPPAYMDEFCALLAVATPHPDYTGELPDPCSGILFQVRINEFLPNPDGTDSGHEFVEIVNVGQAPVDLAGWTLGDAVNPERHVFAPMDLEPGEAVVVFDGPDNVANNLVVASTEYLGLNNNGDEITLRDAEGAVVDRVAYVGADSGIAWNRDPDFGLEGDFVQGTPTPGLRADGTAAAKEIIFNEVLANAAGNESDNEFVELVNVSDRTIVLEGWELTDEIGVKHTFPTGFDLDPGQSLVVWSGGDRPGDVVADSSLGLNNGGDTITLLDPLGTVVDEFTWTTSAAADGESYNRTADADRDASWDTHGDIPASAGALASPGTRLDGSSWAGRVIVNELMPNPAGTDDGNEWVEIVNIDVLPADVSGWMLGDAVNPARHVFSSRILAPGEVLVIFDSGDHTGEVPASIAASTGLLSLNNSGDLITLTDATGHQRDAVTYRASTEDTSLNRAVDGDPGSSLVDHDLVPDAVGGSSPGTRADGTAF